MSIKLIVMDVDCILINSKNIIIDKTKQDLTKVQEDGILLVLASGRPTSLLMDLAKGLKMDENNGLLVSFNGFKVIDCETNEVLFNETMSI